MNNFYCALSAQHRKASGIGTVKPISKYILLEYPYPFTEKAAKNNSIPESVKRRLNTYLDKVGGKLLLIRQEQKNTTSLSVFFHCNRHACFNQQTIQTYEDLLAIDLTDAFKTHSEHHVTTGHFFICTNGTRDKCCAKFGQPIYKKFQSLQPNNTWQCSHIGGHQFAPTGIFFPSGICYGSIRADQVENLINREANKEVCLPNYRGRTAYKKQEQAAEYFLRKELNNIKNTAIQLLSSHPISEEEFKVYFEETASKIRYVVKVMQVRSKEKYYASCRQDKLAYAFAFQLVSCDQVDVDVA